jgi:hypothetical protein
MHLLVCLPAFVGGCLYARQSKRHFWHLSCLRACLPKLVVPARRGLRTNNFDGPLPDSWGTPYAFLRLKTVYLSYNNLSGIIPEAWTDMPSLRRLCVLRLPCHRRPLAPVVPWGDPAGVDPRATPVAPVPLRPLTWSCEICLACKSPRSRSRDLPLLVPTFHSEPAPIRPGSPHASSPCHSPSLLDNV